MILLYLIFFFLVLRFTVTLFNFISNPKLTRSPKDYDDLVSILIPVRGEAPNILFLLQSIKEQDYKNYEVILLDETPSEHTGNLCEHFCEDLKNFRVIPSSEPPADWLGRSYACYQLAKEAKGKFMMFLHADEVVANGLINNSIHRMKLHKLSLLSLFTNQIMLSWGERMIVPLMHYILLNLLPLRLVSLSRNPVFSAASGQFMLFESQNYVENQWHEQVKGKINEDLEIMKLVKGYGYKGEALLANGYIFCRMYKNLPQAINGFSKNLLAGFNNNFGSLFLYIFLVVLGPIAVMTVLSAELVLFALALIFLTRAMISLMAGQNLWYNFILHPVQLFFMVIIAALSLRKYFTKKLAWKERNFRT